MATASGRDHLCFARPRQGPIAQRRRRRPDTGDQRAASRAARPHSQRSRSVGQRLRHRLASPDHIVTLSDESVRENAR
jgi:hypothetical protein